MSAIACTCWTHEDSGLDSRLTTCGNDCADTTRAEARARRAAICCRPRRRGSAQSADAPPGDAPGEFTLRIERCSRLLRAAEAAYGGCGGRPPRDRPWRRGLGVRAAPGDALDVRLVQAGRDPDPL